jgi:hypothetical protein
VLTTRAALDARHAGVEIREIEEELGSLENAILEALEPADAGAGGQLKRFRNMSIGQTAAQTLICVMSHRHIAFDA